MDKKERRRRRLSRTLGNAAMAATGTAAGYMGGGALAKALPDSPRFKAQYKNMSPASRRLLKRGLRGAGTAAGLVAAGIASHRLIPSSSEKVAAMCTSVYRGYV